MTTQHFLGIIRQLAVLLVLAWVLPANGESRVKISNSTVDGLQIRQLDCRVRQMSLLAGLVILGAIAKQKHALDRCLPAGGAFEVRGDWTGRRPAITNLRSSHPSRASCVRRALLRTRVPLGARCRLIVLVGKKHGATRALERLVPAK